MIPSHTPRCESFRRGDSPHHLTVPWALTPQLPTPLRHATLHPHQGVLGEVLTQPDAPTSPPSALLITPGLINAHSHLEWTLLPDELALVAEAVDAPLPSPSAVTTSPYPHGMARWLSGVVAYSRRSADHPEVITERIRLGIQQSLQAGVTHLNDISRDGASLPLLQQAGLGGVVSIEAFCLAETIAPDAPPPVLQAVAAHYQHSQAMAGGGPLRVGLSPHAPYNVSLAAWRWLVATCQPTVVHTHWLESPQERHWQDHGPDPSGISGFHQDVLGTPTPAAAWPRGQAMVNAWCQLVQSVPTFAAAHGVFATPDEALAFQRAGGVLLHCPSSNLWLQGQTITPHHWQSGPIALGTDSPLSAPSLDLRDEGRLALTHHQAHGITGRDVFTWVTTGGAHALGRSPSRLGTLQPSAPADLIGWTWQPHVPPEDRQHWQQRWEADPTRLWADFFTAPLTPCWVMVNGLIISS